MSENHRGVVAKRIVKHVDIRATDSAIGDLELYFVVSTTRLLNFSYFNVPFTTRIFD